MDVRIKCLYALILHGKMAAKDAAEVAYGFESVEDLRIILDILLA